ncbi:MAG: T9SS type A sorting domain-containing protein [Chitinophagales bacterium]|nr:T9SS type A sorting domain-containing protein [Chitinophagales bacterium]
MKNILLFVFLMGSASGYTQGLYAFYPFNGNARDTSGNGHHATLHGNPALTNDRFGNPNSAYLFDGQDDYIEMPEAFDFKPRTISLWFKAMAFTVEGVIFSSDYSGTQNADSKFVVNESDGLYTLNLKIGNISNNYVQPLGLNQWYHAAIVYSDTAIKYYVNGDLVGSYNNLANAHSNNGVAYATVGRHRTPINFFHGVIDDVKINDVALTEAEINETFTGIASLKEEFAFSCFPNPASDRFQLETEVPVTASIFNAQGQLVLSNEVNNKIAVIDVSGLAKGVYFLQAQEKQSARMVRRVIIKQ